MVQKVGKVIKPHFKAESLTFAVQVKSQCSGRLLPQQCIDCQIVDCPPLPDLVCALRVQPTLLISKVSEFAVPGLTVAVALHAVTLCQAEACVTFNVTLLQDGPAAGQSVPHVHVHVLPRKKGDFANNDEVYDAIDDKANAYNPE